MRPGLVGIRFLSTKVWVIQHNVYFNLLSRSIKNSFFLIKFCAVVYELHILRKYTDHWEIDWKIYCNYSLNGFNNQPKSYFSEFYLWNEEHNKMGQ